MELFNIPCGKNLHWYLLVGFSLVNVDKVKANLLFCFSWSIEKKQSFKSITIIGHALGNTEVSRL